VKPENRAPLRVLVTGSREWRDKTPIYEALDELAARADVTVVHGACPRGADTWASLWARMDSRATNEPHPANWKQRGASAGFIRNSAMVRLGADLCLAFIRNESNGATHCATEAERAGIPTVVFRQTYPDLSVVADALAMVAGGERA